MIGIKSVGVYIPLWRLDLACAQGGWKGEKAIAGFDEDSLTMGVAAAMDCIAGVDREAIDGLFFASTTHPYREKQVSVLAATALDLPSNILTLDFANSLRAGTTALKAAVDIIKGGGAKQILVIAADTRLPMPGSDFERELGDGAAAFLITGTDAKVAVRDSYCIADEILDVWRLDDDKFIRSWEERFSIDEGYSRVLPEAIGSLLKRNNLKPKEIAKAVFPGPNARRHSGMGKALGFANEQIEPHLFGTVGDTGSAFSLMLLAACLEKSKPGDKIVVGGYGSGADALLLDVIENVRPHIKVSALIQSKAVLNDYKRYLNWRKLLEMTTGRRRPPTPAPSATCLWREIDQNYRLHGVKCKKCGMVQYPPQLVCIECHSRDQFEIYKLQNKPAKLATYTEDYASPTPNPPLILAVIDFQGGGRMWAYMTDKGDTQIEIGMPVELTFRKLFTSDGIHNYYWKCTPVRC